VTRINFKRFPSTTNPVAFWVVTLLIYLVMIILVVVTWNAWDTTTRVIAVLGMLTFGGLALAMLCRRWLSRPDFITKHGTGIWTGGIKEITPGLMEEALDYYLAGMLCLRQSSDPATIFIPLTSLNGSLDKFILTGTRKDLEDMLDGANIEWRKNLVTISWRLLFFCLFFPSHTYKSIRACDLQRGKSMVVQWQGSIAKSGFFHGLQHMTDEVVLGELPDSDHVDSFWWHVADKFDREFGG
jgi:hypothetical protein